MSDGHDRDVRFAGSMPEAYDRHLVPPIFDAYADELVARLHDLDLGSVLEVAAGTGVLTRAIAARLRASVAITATDLSPSMLDYAQSVGTARPVVWQTADVIDLPFADASFDAVVCQFGVMFFPDRPAAFAEVSRVLRPGGVFLFTVWDAIENNDFAAVVTDAVAALFPDDPPDFLPRTPYAYFDEATIQADVAAGGFVSPARFEAMEARSRAPSPDVPAIGFCQGTPLRTEIEARGSSRLAEATAAAAKAIGDRFGTADVDGKMRGYVVTGVKG
jgi:SAM-dependent methyltransferase